MWKRQLAVPVAFENWKMRLEEFMQVMVKSTEETRA